jgi:hypothetical protein
MKLQTIALAAAISALASAALAAGPGQATLQNPLAKPVSVIAGDGIWTCQGEACSTGSVSDQSLTIDACRTLAKAVGPITAYVVDGSSLRPAPLARCNAVSASH